MSNNKIYTIIILILFAGSIGNLLAQTSNWKVVWDRNPQSDNIGYYVIFREINTAPTISSTIVGQIQNPSSQTPDSLIYTDTNIQPGVHYFYSVQAFNQDDLSGSLSEATSAAIPEILFNQSMVLKTDTTYLMSLNHPSFVNDPDHDPSQLVWTMSGSNQITASIIHSNNSLVIETPSDTTISETFQFSVTDPKGFFDSKSMTIRLTKSTPIEPPPPPPPPSTDDETEKVIAYPVPFVASDPPPCGCITFQIPPEIESAKLLIYNVMGDLIFTASDLAFNYNWSVVNSSGTNISPGVYIYYVQDGSGKQIDSGKVVVVR